jgi:multiple antibiotic resistance protein
MINNILIVASLLFGVIDIFGSIPILYDVKQKRNGNLNTNAVTIASGILMISFLFGGDWLLDKIGLGVPQFAIAGGIVIFIMALEMILGIQISKPHDNGQSSEIIPAAFPVIAGTGTLSTILSLTASYSYFEILSGIILNLGIIYLILCYLDKITKFIGENGMILLRNIMGVVLLAIAVQMILSNFKLIWKI